MASKISAHSPVRRLLVERQKAMVALGGFVLEGRDATTVIAPEADLRVYLTASLEERARRRYLEQQAKGSDASLDDVRQDVAERDHRDITRADSPLMVGPGVHVVESGGIPVAEVVKRIIALL
jgi:cytidylate kinase